ncbi:MULTISPECIES: acyl-CoA thioesterase [Priestia]|uniref:Acyl-CoA thioesterase n=1 Tax=Priestia filamentosa TaxID=1402861 RepID=A0A1X7ER90_9BACI|nr:MULTISPECIES: acyl-CoA thioesterase [Priestia]AKO93240.1 acyl-CoA thioesterase [Priestia filamentosa]MCY8234580.1 acyl-CoA thioesterase [Priestia endophytica]MDT3763386.1 acyl-CoA thioesterase [Priestia filamentosa]MED3728626.1 acyl-CoA thioesterase [Priestia filamentosa]OXS69942.1 acyl-CoA thioesterase [Priestia filamentosa]
MNEQTEKYCKESLVVRTSRVFPLDTNNHNTLFGGKLMSYIDDVASISAARHSRGETVTASTDSVDFLSPIRPEHSVCLESYVTWVGTSSMEVFVKIIAETLKTGERRLAATSFLTFVALDENGKPKRVPRVIPQSDEEIMLHNTAKQRAEERKNRRKHSQALAQAIGTDQPWS